MQKLYYRETRKATAVNDRSRNGGRRVHYTGVYGNDVRTRVKLLDIIWLRNLVKSNKESKFLYTYLYGKKKKKEKR